MTVQGKERRPPSVPQIALRNYIKLLFWIIFGSLFLLLRLPLTHLPLKNSVTECKFCYTFVFLCLFPSFFALPSCSHVIFPCSSIWFLLPAPFFLTVILSSSSSFFSSCQIFLSTLGKLHFLDYTPIKGPIGTLLACYSSFLETEKWTVCVCMCVSACTVKQAF